MVDHNRGWWTTHGNRGTVDASRVEHKRTARWRVTDGDGSVWNVQVQRMRVIRKAYGNDKVETQVQVGHIDRTRMRTLNEAKMTILGKVGKNI